MLPSSGDHSRGQWFERVRSMIRFISVYFSEATTYEDREVLEMWKKARKKKKKHS